MLELLSQHRCFGGVQRYYKHNSTVIGLPMRFSVFLPPQAEHGKVPAIFYLAGLTCTEETFMIKAGAQRLAAELGIALVTPDTSPRDTGIEGEKSRWDFGAGAGFYLNATEQPWAQHFRMESYVARELFDLVGTQLPVDAQRISIMGHSMGGHGALTLAFKHTEQYRSVSAFAPICNPTECAWGQYAFERYLGADATRWSAYDASRLIAAAGRPLFEHILVDQGTADSFLKEGQLRPEALQQACARVGQALVVREQAGYDHGYYFIQTFMEDHLKFHAGYLSA